MKSSLCLIGLLVLLMSGLARGETIGLGFIVDEDLISRREAVSSELNNWVETLNGYYRNSQVDLQAEIAFVDFAPIKDKEVLRVLDAMSQERDGFTNLFRRAGEYGADYSVAVVGGLLVRGKRGCGRALDINRTHAALASTRKALAAVEFACGAHTLAHELGHLMGLNHGTLVDTCDPGKNHTAAIAPYANGYGVGNCDGKRQAGEWGDIMVGGAMRTVTGNQHDHLAIFSNPRLRDPRCGASGVCGDEKTGDAARALNENAHLFASHEEPDVHVLPYRDAALAACIYARYKDKEIAELKRLECPRAQIVSVHGMGRLNALQEIDLAGNPLVDLGDLETLSPTVVRRIDLSASPNLPCAALARLEARFPGRIRHSTQCGSEGR